MRWFELLAMSMPTPAGTEPDPRAQQFFTPVLIAGMCAMFYFLMIRPQNKQRKEHENMLKNVESGDKILTSGGLYGIVTNVKEKSLMVKIADNVKVEIAKSALTSVTKKSADGDGASGDSK